jgi:hypothetical protein
MLITTEQKTVTTVEVELPAYYYWTGDYYKILDENNAIVVTDYDFSFGIRKCGLQKHSIAKAAKDGERITEENFLDVFHRVGEKVKRELIKAIETDGWKAQEQNELLDRAVAIIK